MPGKSQPYSDAVLNVLRGTAIAGVSPYLGLFSVAPGDDIRRERSWPAMAMPGRPSPSPRR